MLNLAYFQIKITERILTILAQKKHGDLYLKYAELISNLSEGD